jgi:CheY-like chemotaxis protein
MLMDESLTIDTIRERALVGRSEAQMRHEILPDGDERQTFREKIEMYDLVLELNCAWTPRGTLPIRVLVADDSDVMRRSVTRYLSSCEEVEVVGEASDFEETAKLVGECQPEIVVIDLRMSRKVDSKTRNIREICDCKIIAMSAHIDEETEALTERIGADGFIDKFELYPKLLPTILRLAGQP